MVRSEIHALAYSFIGLQTVYLATYFNPVYWNTACLRVDAGLEEDAATNYGKIAKAVGNIIYRGIKVSLIDINKSQYMFEPDVENDSILYGFKALNGVGGEIIQEIEANRPYNSLEDFLERTKCNKTVMISLIKSGAFDKFAPREEIMRQYIWSVCEPKKRITLQNFNGLNERGLIPEELDFEKRLFVFNKALRKFCKLDSVYTLPDNFYEFYQQFFDVDLTTIYDGFIAIDQEVWKKLYTKNMDGARTYFKSHSEELLEKLNNSLFQEMWDKYATGSLADWEMNSVGFYFHDHPLKNINRKSYGIYQYRDLGENPEVDYTFKRNGIEIPIFKTVRICGTVIAKDDTKSQISILTPESGVVTVKFNRDYYAKYKQRLSEVQPDGTKKVREAGWFQRGVKVLLNGYRRGDMFMTKAYKKTGSHQLYKITDIRGDAIEMTNKRWGEDE